MRRGDRADNGGGSNRDFMSGGNETIRNAFINDVGACWLMQLISNSWWLQRPIWTASPVTVELLAANWQSRQAILENPLNALHRHCSSELAQSCVPVIAFVSFASIPGNNQLAH